MSARHPLQKRIAVWTAVAVLLLAAYVLGAPFVILLAGRHCPRALPFLDATYAPLHVYVNNPEVPGSDAYNNYALWCQRQFEGEMIYDTVPNPAEPILRE